MILILSWFGGFLINFFIAINFSKDCIHSFFFINLPANFSNSLDKVLSIPCNDNANVPGASFAPHQSPCFYPWHFKFYFVSIRKFAMHNTILSHSHNIIRSFSFYNKFLLSIYFSKRIHNKKACNRWVMTNMFTVNKCIWANLRLKSLAKYRIKGL